MRSLIPGLIVVLLGCWTANVQAQPYYRGGYAGPYYDNRAATPAESYARGASDLVRSAGQTNLNNSEAAINYEQARSAELDNRMKQTDTYFQMRQANDAYRAAERGPADTPSAAYRRSAAAIPDRMAPSQLDPVTGEINWPMILQEDQYADYRNQIEAMFAHRAETQGHVGPDEYQKLGRVCDALASALKDNIRDYRPNDYVAAKNFVESLSFEASIPVG